MPPVAVTVAVPSPLSQVSQVEEVVTVGPVISLITIVSITTHPNPFVRVKIWKPGISPDIDEVVSPVLQLNINGWPPPLTVASAVPLLLPQNASVVEIETLSVLHLVSVLHLFSVCFTFNFLNF